MNWKECYKMYRRGIRSAKKYKTIHYALNIPVYQTSEWYSFVAGWNKEKFGIDW